MWRPEPPMVLTCMGTALWISGNYYGTSSENWRRLRKPYWKCAGEPETFAYQFPRGALKAIYHVNLPKVTSRIVHYRWNGKQAIPDSPFPGRCPSISSCEMPKLLTSLSLPDKRTLTLLRVLWNSNRLRSRIWEASDLNLCLGEENAACPKSDACGNRNTFNKVCVLISKSKEEISQPYWWTSIRLCATKHYTNIGRDILINPVHPFTYHRHHLPPS